jgi:hypothetical protein
MFRKYKISRKDIWNFDEIGFRVGCPKGQEVYVPLEIKEVSYFVCLILGSRISYMSEPADKRVERWILLQKSQNRTFAFSTNTKYYSLKF